jgi:hypothetical protein
MMESWREAEVVSFHHEGRRVAWYDPEEKGTPVQA